MTQAEDVLGTFALKAPRLLTTAPRVPKLTALMDEAEPDLLAISFSDAMRFLELEPCPLSGRGQNLMNVRNRR